MRPENLHQQLKILQRGSAVACNFGTAHAMPVEPFNVYMRSPFLTTPMTWDYPTSLKTRVRAHKLGALNFCVLL